MWNLLSVPSASTFYKPSASTGTITNPSYAWDADTYPWSTRATTSKVGSSVAGTMDTTEYVFTTFPTLSKANFSSVNVTVAADILLTPWGLSPGYAVNVVGCSVDVYYSADGGSTWSIMARYPYEITNGIVSTYYYETAQVHSVTIGYHTNIVNNSKISISASISSTSFTTGLQDLQVKFVAYTLTSTLPPEPGGVPLSSVALGAWDIVAEVS